MAENKTDSFVGFDPTQVQGQGCCGKVRWDFATQTWRESVAGSADENNGGGNAPDCSAVQAQLDAATNEIAETKAKLEEAKGKATALEQASAEKDATIATLRQLLAEEQATNASLRAQLNGQPSVCDVLKAHLEPVYRLNGEVVYYGLKNPPECLSGSLIENTSLGGENLTYVAAESSS